MDALSFLKILADNAKVYSKEAKASLVRNNHMNEIKISDKIEQKVIDAVLADFINHIGLKNGIDFAMYTLDLNP